MHEHELAALVVQELEELVWTQRRFLHRLGRAETAVDLVARLDLLHLTLPCFASYLGSMHGYDAWMQRKKCCAAHLRIGATFSGLHVLVFRHTVDLPIDIQRHPNADLIAYR